ncbi:SDR family NAD(P)-dependent oxidoreductase [Alkaliphilus peptidifermentans]|uniref:NADP-dependent 3-hydroxy acid dehydrogenase YdfG n=1 Tax=Alkaliphilus peptidifermentans DSM 18978 TaxID=1120976 RepID=A0A1G5L1T9_9FIRM|nr:SDR family NAD(P)-dependent oxidoreductase [Alkaliphilus peptidifermentans]SCZ06260.1 NADP-dependent 3-hydroxy acid dehydrogenase YdfG [Alkaliphilus peptidifermentans DSM 18978]
MKEFKNKVAVITGAANGFGVEMAKECVARDMKVVLADIDSENLKKVEADMKAKGAEVLSVEMDVSKFEDVEILAKKTLETFGSVDLLFNNAGVVVAGPTWELPLNDWDWIMGVNVYGMIYGLKVFIPIMLKQDTPCHIVNVASVAGLLTTPSMAAYHTTKFANVGLTESVNYQLQAMNSKIKMSLFCPGFVQTDLHNCDRHRPERFAINRDEPYYESVSYKQGLERGKHVITTGIPVDSIGQSIFIAIEEEQFYILTHPQYAPVIGGRVRNMLEGVNPSVAMFKK